MVGNKIIFNSNFSDDILSYFSSLGDSIEISDKKIVEHIGKKPWTLNEFKKQNWGHNFHSIAPYIGRIKPSFAHWLIKLTTNSEDTVLDPFCGSGTFGISATSLDRNYIGYDLNPISNLICKVVLSKDKELNEFKYELDNLTKEIKKDEDGESRIRDAGEQEPEARHGKIGPAGGEGGGRLAECVPFLR